MLVFVVVKPATNYLNLRVFWKIKFEWPSVISPILFFFFFFDVVLYFLFPTRTSDLP